MSWVMSMIQKNLKHLLGSSFDENDEEEQEAIEATEVAEWGKCVWTLFSIENLCMEN